MSLLSIRHLLGLRDVPASDIQQILDAGEQFRDVLERPSKKVPALKGVTVVNLFFEDSTRTRISFELAEKRLSADTVNFSSSGSSLNKGESLLDTVRNIEAMKVDLAVVRHKGTGVPGFLAQNTRCQILNAGDGANEHPTQALLDMLTIRRALGELKGARVAIIGDIRHSRVARSNCYGLRTMGADVVLCGPPTLMPKHMDAFDVQVEKNLEDAIRGADVVMALRLQKERQDDGLLPSDREYRQVYGITQERLDAWNPKAKILHPGPINRNTELDSTVADGANSLIMEQVTNGVAVRMAALYLLAGGNDARA
jgi:aspartate carbamoyltransferase catalytic subunit